MGSFSLNAFFWKYIIIIRQIQKEKSGLEKMEEGLAKAREAIRDATRSRNYSSYKHQDFVPRGVVYLNPYAFHQLRFFSNFFNLLYFIILLNCSVFYFKMPKKKKIIIIEIDFKLQITIRRLVLIRKSLFFYFPNN